MSDGSDLGSLSRNARGTLLTARRSRTSAEGVALQSSQTFIRSSNGASATKERRNSSKLENCILEICGVPKQVRHLRHLRHGISLGNKWLGLFHKRVP